MSRKTMRGESLLKLGVNPFKMFNKSKDAARGVSEVVKKKKKKLSGSFKVKALGAGTVFGAGAYTDHALKLRQKAKNPYNTYSG